MKNFLDYIRDVPDFPKPGIVFKDITPLLQNRSAFRDAIEVMRAIYQPKEIDVVVGIDARGFILGGALAHQLEVGLFRSAKAENCRTTPTKLNTILSTALTR